MSKFKFENWPMVVIFGLMRILLCVAFIVLAYGCARHDPAPDTAQSAASNAVYSVSCQHSAILSNATYTAYYGGRGVQEFNAPLYLRTLKEIKTDACPTDFRVSWLSYVQSVERSQRFTISDAAAAVSNPATLLKDRSNFEAFQKLQLSAMRYGVNL